MWPSNLPTLRTPTLLRRRGASEVPELKSHTSASRPASLREEGARPGARRWQPIGRGETARRNRADTQAALCLLITCVVMLVACNVRQLQNAFRVPRGVYYLQGDRFKRHRNATARARAEERQRESPFS